MSHVSLSFKDVFHWGCLNSFAASLPTNTAPAGYTCPNCKVRVTVKCCYSNKQSLFFSLSKVPNTEHCMSNLNNLYLLLYLHFIPFFQSAIFPPEKQISPVADQLRKLLASAPWARVGLGLPVVSTRKTNRFSIMALLRVSTQQRVIAIFNSLRTLTGYNLAIHCTLLHFICTNYQ